MRGTEIKQWFKKDDLDETAAIKKKMHGDS